MKMASTDSARDFIFSPLRTMETNQPGGEEEV